MKSVVLVCLLFKALTASTNFTLPCTDNLKETVDITNGLRFNDSIIFENITYHPENYFLHDDKILGCVCNIKICLNKCCALDKMFVGRRCQEHQADLNISVYRETEKSSLTMADFYLIRIKKITCLNNYMLTKQHRYYIQENGDIYSRKQNLTNQSEYCFEGNYADSEVTVLVCAPEEKHDPAMVTSFIGKYICIFLKQRKLSLIRCVKTIIYKGIMYFLQRKKSRVE